MLNGNLRDVVAGLALALMGAMIAGHAYLNLELGTLRRMGPGMVPWGLGLTLLALGLAIGAKGVREGGGSTATLSLRPLAFVALAIGIFALSVEHLGVLPAVFLLICVATFAERGMSPARRLMLAVGLCAFCYVVFALLLQLNLPMFDWRF